MTRISQGTHKPKLKSIHHDTLRGLRFSFSSYRKNHNFLTYHLLCSAMNIDFELGRQIFPRLFGTTFFLTASFLYVPSALAWDTQRHDYSFHTIKNSKNKWSLVSRPPTFQLQGQILVLLLLIFRSMSQKNML